MNMTTDNQTPQVRPAFPAELKPVLAAALKGDRQAQDQMAAAFDRLPEFALEIGNLSHLARGNVMKLLDGENPTLREALVRRADQLQTELAREGDSTLEHLLIDRVVVSWLWAHFGDLQLADRLQNHVDNGALCRDATQRAVLLQKLFTNSVKSLGLLRKLLAPRVTPLDLINAGSPEAARPRRRAAGPTNRLAPYSASN